MKTKLGPGDALVILAGALVLAAAACHSEPVIPFMDAGDPCSSPTHTLDCSEFADTTCGTTSTSCPRLVYGCEDAAPFSREDYSECPPEAGLDAPSLGDVSLLGDGALLGDAGEAGGDAASE